MKITLFKIGIIFVFLFSYCTIETVFLNRFSNNMMNMASELQSENVDADMKKTYSQMQLYIDNRQILLDLMMSKNEQEIIGVSLGRIRDYLEEGKKFEARVAAGEIKSYLIDVNAPFNTKK